MIAKDFIYPNDPRLINIKSMSEALELSILHWKQLYALDSDELRSLNDSTMSNSCGLCRFTKVECENCPLGNYNRKNFGCSGCNGRTPWGKVAYLTTRTPADRAKITKFIKILEGLRCSL
jgi:hypothetical protein